MTRTIQTTYRYRLDPTAEQEAHFARFAGARRFVWNWALGRKRDSFQQTGKTLGFNALCIELTQLKQEPDTAWLREMDSQSLQQALRDLDSAYQHFFRRLKKGEKNKGFPRFKSRKTDTPRFRIPQRVTLEGTFVVVPKIGVGYELCCIVRWKASRRVRRSNRNRAAIGMSAWRLNSRSPQEQTAPSRPISAEMSA